MLEATTGMAVGITGMAVGRMATAGFMGMGLMAMAGFMGPRLTATAGRPRICTEGAIGMAAGIICTEGTVLGVWGAQYILSGLCQLSSL